MPLSISNEETGRIKVTGTTDSDTEIVAGGNPVGLKFIYWYNPTSSGDLCNLVDSNGVEIFPMRAAFVGDSQQWGVFKYVDGIHCDDMDSGTLYLYLR